MKTVKYIVQTIAIILCVILVFGVAMQMIMPEGKRPSDWFEDNPGIENPDDENPDDETPDEPTIKSYTAEADDYSNLKKFAYWSENGEKVSEVNPYTYEAEAERQLTAVYEEFMDVDVALGNSGEEGYEETVYSAADYTLNSCWWMNTARVNEPLKYGMTIEFTVQECVEQILFGVSEREVAYNLAGNAWNVNFPNLFVPTYNYYAGMELETIREDFGYLSISNAGAVGGKEYFTNCSKNIPYSTGSANPVKIRIVLDDTLLLYINDELVTADEFANYNIDRDTEYFFTFAASNTSMTITDFGYDHYISERGKLTNSDLVSDELSVSDFNGKKMTFLGDSITYGVGASDTSPRYSTVLSNSLGMTEVNMGVSGTVYCTGGTRTSRINDVQNIPIDSDYIFVLLGINDFDNAISGQCAEMGESDSTDTSTIYGALNVMYRSIVDRFRCTDTVIYIGTPVITSWNNSVTADRDWDQSKVNACGYSLPEMCESIEKTAQYYGLVCIDLNEKTVLGESDFADGIHPNDVGAAKIADTLKTEMLKNYHY